MPIELRTGLPGAGKTLGAVERLIELRKQHPDRPLKVLGVTGLRGDLGDAITPDDFRNWEQYPAGTIIVVDEVQKYCGARRSGDVPAWIGKLSEHRHLGLEFIFITQHPSLIDAYVRRLVDRHIHTVRKFNTHWVTRYEWPDCVEDVKSKKVLKDADRKSRHKYTQEAMNSYTSSELHTMQKRIPPFIYIAIAFCAIIPALLGVAYFVLKHRGETEAALIHKPESSHSMFSGQGASREMTTEDWEKRMTPRVKGVPWSAPMFDSLAVVTVPDLRCIIIERDDGARDCHCYSEQDTRVEVDAKACYKAATDGVYNPYRPKMQDRETPVAKASSVAPISSPDGGPVASVEGAGGAAWKESAMRANYTPPELVPLGTPIKSGTGM